jgi:dipeptidyl aminopeptidase/acylaminoacyl peptidase
MSLRAFAACLALAIAVPALAQTPPAASVPATPTGSVERVQRGNLITEGVPAIPADVRDRLIQYNNVRSAGFAGFTETGGILISTRFGETGQLHEVAQPLGMRRQLTFFPEPVSGGIRPDGSNAVVFTKDRGGDEFFQAFLFNRATGTSTAFTEAGTRNDSLVWSRDGRIAAWSVARSGVPTRQIVVGDPSNPADRRVVFTGPSGISPLAFSPDGTRLLYGEYISVTHSRRFVLDLASGTSTEVNPSNAPIAYDGGEFSADGRSIFVISDQGSEFARLVRIDLASGAQTPVSAAVNWDIEGFTISRDGRRLAYVVNEGGNARLRLLDLRTGREMRRPELPQGVITGLDFDRSGQRVGVSLSTPTTPGDVWVWDLRRSQLVRWTESETGGLPSSTFVEPTLVETTSFDGRRIPAFLYTPRTPGPHPVIISIHGGPEAQSRTSFSSAIQYWVNELGVAVLVPNVRGSTGYGRTFVSLDNGKLREDSVRDIGAFLDWIATRPDLDRNRVVTYGGSYGGYMVLATLVHYSDRLAGGINIVGISNFVTFLENTQGYRVDLRRVEYGDERDPAMRAFLQSISPLTNVDRIRRPLFVIQGANDPRVPQSEAEQIVQAVRGNGGEVWYMLALDEGHGFARLSNRASQREAETMFLRRVFGLGDQ